MARDAEKLAAQGDRIRQLRKFARVTQEAAAGAVGVTLRGYQRWERGEGELKPDNIRSLAAYFATTPDYIEYGEREVGPTPNLSLRDDAPQLDRIEAKLDELLTRLPATLPAASEDAYPPELQALVQTLLRQWDELEARKSRAQVGHVEDRRRQGRPNAA